MVSDTAYIPTIDIAPFLADPESEAAAVIVEEMRHACTHSGFFSIVGHGVPRELQDRVLAAAKALFGLPLAEKESLRPKKPLSNRGYEVMGQQVLQPGTLPDFREGFYISKHVPASDPRCAANPAFVGENIFPTTLPDDVVKEPCEAYYDIVFDLACKVLRIIAKGMPYGDDVFDEFVSDIPICTMRLLHYPPQRSNDARQLGAGAHTDFGGSFHHLLPKHHSASPLASAARTGLYGRGPWLLPTGPGSTPSGAAPRDPGHFARLHYDTDWTLYVLRTYSVHLVSSRH